MTRQGLSKNLISRLLPDAKHTMADLEKMYPPRNLPDGAMVTRFAPSPTGFMHLGGLYQMLINYKLAKQSGGVFILRIEDTDTKREIGGAVRLIQNSLISFGLNPDEQTYVIDVGNGEFKGNKPQLSEYGEYGNYVQSQRKEIYHSVAAELLEKGLAYPCFLKPKEMEEIREKQKSAGYPTGIYSEFARDRNLSESKIIEHLDAGEIPSIRLYSNGDPSRKIFCKDAARGSIAFPENNEDIVLIKSNDGLPTYHFAHLCDDHFMRTTNVVRGEEWLPSLPLHIQLFSIMDWTPPVYVHTSTLDKIDPETGNQRKLSKRHDPEASVAMYLENGWPTEAVLEYLLNIVSSGYEEEKAKNPNTNLWNYPIKIKKIPMSGALFDMKKLEWWAREHIGTMDIDKLLSSVIDWVKEYGDESAKSKVADTDYLRNILSIERDNPKRVRKDFITWKQTLEEIAYFFDDEFAKTKIPETNKQVLSEFLKTFDINDDKDIWWKKITDIAAILGLKNGDAAMSLRVALTGRTNTPDLYSVIQVMGKYKKDMVIERINKCLK